MARTMSTTLKANLDTAIGNSGAVKVLAAINATHTAFDGPTRATLAKIFDGIGEATAFETSCTTNGTVSVAAVNKLEHELKGRGNAEELVLCIADGTIT
jgi:hypothetical protein